MGNYLRKLLSRDWNDMANALYLIAIRLCTFIHITLLVIFIALKIWPLVIFNVASIVLYSYLTSFVKKRQHYLMCLNFVYFEILIHSVLSTILIGNLFGFHLYILGIIPISFYLFFLLSKKGRLYTPTVYAFISFFVFSFANVFNFARDSFYSIETFNRFVVGAIYVYNSLIVFVMLILFTMLFILQIHTFMKKIESQNERLTFFANVDPLTNLLNRRRFTHELKVFERNKKSFCILLSDVDDFKKINDKYGHDCGDQMLIHISTIFKDIIKDPNLVCRWGGEEIIVAYQGTLEEGAAIGELIRATIANSPITYRGHEIQCTITIGTALYDGRESIEEVIINADNELYRGKRDGKNVVNICRF